MPRRRHESLIPLSRDHHDALSLAFRLLHPSPPGPATTMSPVSTVASRAASVTRFFGEHLDGHFRAEEAVLFPALAAQRSDGDPIAALVRELVAEHRELERQRDEIAVAGERPGPESERQVSRLLDEFGGLLERHVRREERELFVLFDDLVPEPRASQVGPEIRVILDSRRAEVRRS